MPGRDLTSDSDPFKFQYLQRFQIIVGDTFRGVVSKTGQDYMLFHVQYLNLLFTAEQLINDSVQFLHLINNPTTVHTANFKVG